MLQVSVCYAVAMSKEMLQADMFTNELVDNRSSIQKRKARERQLPQQFEMFSQRDLAQFGVSARPKMSIASSTRLLLEIQDPRTPEEIERDRQRAAEKLTVQMFSNPEPKPEVVEQKDLEVEHEEVVILPYSVRLVGLP